MRIRRFGDFLRIIASTLLGMAVRDIDMMIDNMAQYFSQPSGATLGDPYNAAWVTSITIIILFLRNLHGSACYDDFLAKHPEYVPSFERHPMGRVMSFLLSVGGLFLGPALAAHTLQHHMGKDTPVEMFGAVLFSSIIAYTLFDVLLWFDRSTDTAGTAMRQISNRWLKTDLVGVVVPCFLALLYWLFLRGSGGVLVPQLMALLFVVSTTVMIVLDYTANADFYFPAHSSSSQTDPVASAPRRPGGTEST